MNSITKPVTRDRNIDFRSNDGCRINSGQGNSYEENTIVVVVDSHMDYYVS